MRATPPCAQVAGEDGRRLPARESVPHLCNNGNKALVPDLGQADGRSFITITKLFDFPLPQDITLNFYCNNKGPYSSKYHKEKLEVLKSVFF